MKNKIQKFSKGDFSQERPEVIFNETNLVLIIGEGEVYRGHFTIKNKKDGSIRGLVYASSYRIQFKNPGFDTNPVQMEFTYDGRGLRPGHVEKGKITVVCTGGEFELNFTAIIERPYVMTSYGKVQSTDDFRKLAIKDYTEAVRLFRSKEFYEILKYEDERTFYLYDNMRKWSLGEQALEEFLVGIKQKECIFLTLQGDGMLFEDVRESAKGVIQVVKNTWGYMPVEVKIDGNFLQVNKTGFTTEDFVGNNYELEYFVRPKYLHGGRNFGRISLKTPYETLNYEIEVLQNHEYDDGDREEELLRAQILKEYIGCMAGRVELKDWVDSASEKVSSLRRIDPQNEFYQLLQANVYIIGHKTEEAKWVLENYNYNRFAIGKNPEINSYYLYLTALLQDDNSHTERVLDEIGKAYMHHQDSWMLLYMLIHLDPRYANPYKRLEVLEQQYEFGTHEVLFYLEVYRCYQEKLTLLKKLGKFEIQVLNFASKYNLISRELSLLVANFAGQLKQFSEPVFRILIRLYDTYEEPMILNTICTMLIKGNKTQKRYFRWYQRAVQEGLKIAKLYEYYMATLDEKQVKGALPKSVFLYFMHGNTLEYKKEAFLYANLLTHDVGGEELYAAYKDQISAFVWDQLLKRHITDSLRILYKRFCVEEDMNQERLEAMLDICYAYSITTKVPDMKCVLVIEKDGQIRQRTAYEEDDTTVIFLYDKESRIIWESTEGRYYTDSIPYETRRLFYEPRFLDMCQKYGVTLKGEKQTGRKEKATLEMVKERGFSDFKDRDVFRLCTRKIRESDYESDEFLLYLTFEMFRRGQYDKTTLTYLAENYCGATADMKDLWRTLKEYEIPSDKLAERIITQMVFSEDLFGDEEIFLDYYVSGNSYFRLKQAYLAYVSRQYILSGRHLEQGIFEIIANEYKEKEELPDICYVALLKYYADQKTVQVPGNQEEMDPILHQVLLDLCQKQIIFPFYMNYPVPWLREAQLYDKDMISYRAQPGAKVKLYYKINDKNSKEQGYCCELLMPVYEDLYVKQFVLYEGESVTYYFEETCGEETRRSPRRILEKQDAVREGKYGRINDMILMAPARRKKAMTEFEEEEELADELFVTYE